MKSSVERAQLFDFNFVSIDGISKILYLLDPTKNEWFYPNQNSKTSKFPNKLKISDITPIFKKEDPLQRPLLLPPP